MAKLKLNPEPTFKAKVGIPVPGGRAEDVLFTFKHRTGEEMAEWLSAMSDASAPEAVMGCAVGWALDDEFNAENVARLCNNYLGAGLAIFQTYVDELRGARVKN